LAFVSAVVELIPSEAYSQIRTLLQPTRSIAFTLRVAGNCTDVSKISI